MKIATQISQKRSRSDAGQAGAMRGPMNEPRRHASGNGGGRHYADAILTGT